MSRIAVPIIARRGMLAGTSILAALTLLSCSSSSSTSPSSTGSSSTSPSSTSPSSTSPSSTSPSSTSPSSTSSPIPAITLDLKSGDVIICSSTGNGATCAINGTAQVPSGAQVLLWVKPVNPGSNIPGYYIQLSPLGVTQQPQAGASTWDGMIQIGDHDFPPCPGNTFNLIATLDDASTAATLIGQSHPTNLAPKKKSLASAEADNLRVSGVSSCH